MKIILVAGPWGSGTTAVIGALAKLGVPTLGPYWRISDPRTENTYELISFRNLVLEYVDESTLSQKSNYRKEFVPALKEFRNGLAAVADPNKRNGKLELLALKLPLASLCLPEICGTFDTKLICVHRPLREIEASRVRRKWRPVFGAAGAKHIYGRMFSDLVEHRFFFLGVSYADFINNTH